MAIHTQVQYADIEQLVQQFGIKDVVEYKPMKQGLRNSNYVITTEEQKIMLRICDDQTIEQAYKQIQLLRFLKKCRFPAPEYINPIINEEKIVLFGNKPVIITQYIEGETIDQLSINEIAQVGTAMEGLHQLIPFYCMTMDREDFLAREHPYGFAAYKEKISAIKHPYASWFQGKIQHYQKELAQKNKKLPLAVIHGDLWADNALFAENEIQAIIDFESACIMPRVFDIGMTIIGACKNKEGKIQAEKVHALIEGYEIMGKFYKQEKEAIQQYTAYAAAVISIWRFYHFNIQNEERNNQRYQEAVDLCERIEAIPKEKFIEEYIK